MRILYNTNNTQLIDDKAHSLLLPTYIFYYNKEAINNICELFRTENRFTIVLHGMLNDHRADSLLKLLEDSDKEYNFFADYIQRPAEAMCSRFEQELLLPNQNYVDMVKDFIEGKSIELPKSIYFYTELADHTVKNIELLGELINRIICCQSNIFWEQYFFELKKGWKQDAKDIHR